jgi:Carboxypeptidase regulatory-like domain/TonB dependent receptor-like, beta-barrel
MVEDRIPPSCFSRHISSQLLNSTALEKKGFILRRGDHARLLPATSLFAEGVPFMSKILSLTCALFLMLALSAVAFGQSTVSGAIGGVVTNPNKEVVPGASVTVKNTETNKEDTGTTDDHGSFRISNLAPGNYEITITGSGFSTFTQPAVVEVGRITEIDVALSIGPVSENVQVTAEAPVINTAQPDFASNINQTSINELPTNGRRAFNFVLLTPGVVPDGNFGLLSFRGISGLLNNNTVDGGDNNNAFYSEERGRTRITYVVSQASVREFQVNTSNYSAEYGRAAGGVVNTVTQSGTNDFHGSAFFYLRDNKLGATNPTTTRTLLVNGVPVNQSFKPKDVRKQFGGSIGGPILKDRLFFFFTYDESRRDFPGAAVFPTATYLNLSTTDRNILKSRNPAVITDARIDAALNFLAGLTGSVPRTQDQRIFFPKIDWVVNNNHTFTASYNRMRSESPSGVETQPTTLKGIATFGDDFVETDSLNLRLTSTLTPTILNEARFQYGRDNLFAFSNEPSAGEAILATSNGRPPQIGVNGFTFGKQDFLERVANPDEKRWQYADTMTVSMGNHTLKFGGDINRVNDLLDNLRLESASYNYSNLGDFIIDYTNVITSGSLNTSQCFTNTGGSRPSLRGGRCYTSNFQQAFGPTAFRIRTTDFNFFAQDDIRVSPRLTVNVGLRYEYEKLPEPQIPNSLSNLSGQLVGPDQTKAFPSDKNNFGPRFGFAYDVTGDGKTSVRGGYGIYYGRIINSTIINAVSNTGVTAAQRVFSISPQTSGSPVFPNVFASTPALTVGAPAIVVFSDHMANPQIHQADVVFEREIMPNTVVSASFLVSLGRRLPTFIDRNLPAPVSRTFSFVNGGPLNGQTITVPFFTGTRPDTRFGAITEISSSIKSEYTALVLQANRRLSKGLQFQINYTRSRTTDTGQNSATFTFTNGPINPFDLTLEPGRSSLDIPNRFVASAVWNPAVPGGLKDSAVGRAIFNGWTISPIVLVQDGVPYSANISGFGPNSIGGGISGSGALGRIPFIFERNGFRQPKIVNVDLRVSRRFRFTETTNFEILAEAFNLFNRYQVTGVNTNLYTFSGNAPCPSGQTCLNFKTGNFDGGLFGVPNSTGSTIVRERQIQFAARFHF